jgi:hypothetical protein
VDIKCQFYPQKDKYTCMALKKITQTMNNDFTADCHIESAMDKYIQNIPAMNKTTAYEYHVRLTNFENFSLEDYNINCKDGVKDV